MIELDSASVQKQNMRVERNEKGTNLQYCRNRFQQILNSKIPNSNESIETTISKECDSIKTEDTVKIPKSKESIETTKKYDFKETEDTKKIQELGECIPLYIVDVGVNFVLVR